MYTPFWIRHFQFRNLNYWTDFFKFCTVVLGIKRKVLQNFLEFTPKRVIWDYEFDINITKFCLPFWTDFFKFCTVVLRIQNGGHDFAKVCLIQPDRCNKGVLWVADYEYDIVSVIFDPPFFI
jgi:hypothetical protein